MRGRIFFAVVIPASNEEGYIGACLDALLASDAAAGRVGIVVAANGCRDATVAAAMARRPAAEARGWRLVVLDIPEGHKTGAINRADAAIDAGAFDAAPEPAGREAGPETAGPATADPATAGLDTPGPKTAGPETGPETDPEAARGASLETSPAPGLRAYLDADILLDPAMLGQLRAILDRPAPAYASGRLQVAPAQSRATRAYARVWSRLPFMTGGVTGAGFYAVNAAGRRRWGQYPDLIADDIYVRLMFAPSERLGVPAAYSWPMAEGFSRLVRVRRRQNAGVDDIGRRWPELLVNENKSRLGLGGLFGLALRRPADLAVYAAVAAAVRLTRRERQDWSRGR